MKNELIEFFCGFWVFNNALWVKTRKWPVVIVIIARKLLKCNQFVIYISTVFALITIKATFKLQCLVSWITLSNTLRVMSCTQNPFKAALNKVNGLITSEKLSYQNCLWFLCFWICSIWQETKTQKCRKSTKGILS